MKLCSLSVLFQGYAQHASTSNNATVHVHGSEQDEKATEPALSLASSPVAVRMACHRVLAVSLGSHACAEHYSRIYCLQ